METVPTFCYYFIMNTHEIENRFFITTYEAGAEHTPVPTWASQKENPADLDDPQRPAMREEETKLVDIRSPAGGVLCFPHGSHPMHCLHSSADSLSGVKYIIRTDVLFES